MENEIKILLLEDLSSDAELAKREINKTFSNASIIVVDNEIDYVKSLNTFRPDFIVSDFQLPTFNGLLALELKQKELPFVPFIVLTGSMNEDTAVECMKAGADDYVIKEHIKRLGEAMKAATNKKKIEYEKVQTEIDLRNTSQYLAKSRLQLRELNKHVQDIREKERIDISREIHDVIGQSLTALRFDVAWLIKKRPDLDHDVIEKLKSIDTQINDTIVSVQKISTELRPGILDKIGLFPALQWYLKEFKNRTEILTVLEYDEDTDLSENVSTNFYRIVQESLTNIARHAKASRVTISVKEINRNKVMTIVDNGIRIKEEEVIHPKSLGLLGITERVLSIGGNIKINGVEGKGTSIIVSVADEVREGSIIQ